MDPRVKHEDDARESGERDAKPVQRRNGNRVRLRQIVVILF